MDELQFNQLEEQGYLLFNGAATFEPRPEDRCQRPLLRLDDR